MRVYYLFDRNEKEQSVALRWYANRRSRCYASVRYISSDSKWLIIASSSSSSRRRSDAGAIWESIPLFILLILFSVILFELQNISKNISLKRKRFFFSLIIEWFKKIMLNRCMILLQTAYHCIESSTIQETIIIDFLSERTR